MEFERLSIEELKNGYQFAVGTGCYVCNTCKKTYEVGEVYAFNDRFFEAARAIKIHVDTEHGDKFQQLLYAESKYNTFTENQKELLSLLYAGQSDKEIATTLGVSPSTVRHQRFMFREKAKQAKMYLAVYEQVLERKSTVEEEILPIHSNATMVDSRYVITEKEKERILKHAFVSLTPLRLKLFPTKEKKKVVILSTIAEQFERGKRYPEKEVNQILGEIFADYAVLKRYLVDYGFMDRTTDCREYWLK